MHFSGHYPDQWFVLGLRIAHAEEFEQLTNVVLAAVRVLAAESADRVELVGLEVGGPGIEAVGMFTDPWARNVMLA